jgi:predicted sugar kinase
MNEAVGSHLTKDEIRLLIGNNYVEETEDGRVTLGFETGVGPAAVTYGGMAVTGDELSLAYHHPFAEGKNVFVIIPETTVSSSGREEFDLLMNRARNLDYQDRELKAYFILMDLIPALERGDLKKIGDVIWEIEFRGSKRAEVEHHGFLIYEHMSALREQGLEFVGDELRGAVDRRRHQSERGGDDRDPGADGAEGRDIHEGRQRRAEVERIRYVR